MNDYGGSIPDPAEFIKGVTSKEEMGFTVHSINDPHALIQVIGWLKFRATEGEVLFRGQCELFPDIRPSALRGVSVAGNSRLQSAMREYVDQLAGSPCVCQPIPSYRFRHECIEQVRGSKAGSVQSPLIRGTYRSAVEPLLQHYGTATRWLDMVDNVWVALWFACHRQVTNRNYAYHVKRSIAQEGASAMGYIIVIGTGTTEKTTIPGYSTSERLNVIDLRYAVPSVYLRPHAQHGLLVSSRNSASGQKDDLSLNHSILQVLEIRLADALDWLGGGAMLSAHVLFPPAARDEGYRRLLEATPPQNERLGRILTYGPGY